MKPEQIKAIELLDELLSKISDAELAEIHQRVDDTLGKDFDGPSKEDIFPHLFPKQKPPPS